MIKVTELTYNQHPTILKHVCELLSELRNTADETVSIDEQKVVSEWSENKHRHTAFAAFDNDRIVGVITLSECFAIFANGNYGIINELYVVPEYRSRGVGRMLLDRVINIAREKSWRRVDVTAPLGDRWRRTVNFYLREGFVHTGPKLKYLLGVGEKPSGS